MLLDIQGYDYHEPEAEDAFTYEFSLGADDGVTVDVRFFAQLLVVCSRKTVCFYSRELCEFHVETDSASAVRIYDCCKLIKEQLF